MSLNDRSFKIINGLSPPIMDKFFISCKNANNIRNFQIISNKNKKTKRYSQETIKFRTPSLWANLPEEYKLANSLNIFKRKMKNWKCKTCPQSVMPNFSKRSWFYLTLFNCLFVSLKFLLFVLLLVSLL